MNVGGLTGWSLTRANPSRPQSFCFHVDLWGGNMSNLLRNLRSQEEGQDAVEYAVMLAVILVVVVATIRLLGGHANNAFSATASSIQP